MAAACLVAAVVFWKVAPSGFGPAFAIDKDVVAAHVRIAPGRPPDGRAVIRPPHVKPWFAGKLDFAPEVEDLSAQGFTLAGGRLDYIDGRTVAALVYRRRQHIISVLTWPAGAEESPKAESLQGFHVVHWVKHGMASWAVSDLAEEELRELAGLL